MTQIELLNEARCIFAERGVEPALLDAEVLLAHVLGMERVGLYTGRDAAVSDEVTERFHDCVRRRAAGSPVAYLTGVKEFWSLPIRVTPAVLIPRPETELVVEQALAPLRTIARDLRILDLCTGSGCIAAALAKELPHAYFAVADISPEAVEVARMNLAFVAGRVTFLVGDLFQALARSPEKRSPDRPRFDLITANPPYIPSGEIPRLQREIALYEPRAALDGGESGLDFARRIIEDAPGFLLPGGCLVMEMGEKQAQALEAAGRAAGFSRIAISRDLAGRERVISLWTDSSSREAGPSPAPSR